MFLKVTSSIGLVLGLFLLIACSEPSSTSSNDESTAATAPGKIADYPALAKVFCDCAQPSIQLNEQMAKLQEEGKREEFVALAEQVGEKFREAMKCARDLKGKQTTAVLDPKETFKAMVNHCPNIPQKMAENLSNTVK